MRLNNARTINLNALTGIATPRATSTWQPVPHAEVMNTVVNHAKQRNLQIDEIKYQIVPVKNSVYPDMFSTMYMKSDNGTYRNMLGVRNSHNKKFGAAACSGSQVMVCSNGIMSGDHIISKKHTKNVRSSFEQEVSDMFDEVIQTWSNNECRYNGYKNTTLTDDEFDQLLGSSVRHHAINPSKALKVVQEYNEPRHDVFQDRNAWSAFNAFTEIHKESSMNLHRPADQGMALTKVFDTFCTDAIEFERSTFTPAIEYNDEQYQLALDEEPRFTTGEPAVSEWN
jgi:hypothetical protein